MSAWIVTRAHIDVLVLAGVQFTVPYEPAGPRMPTPRILAAAGADLWAENHRSVNSRYGENTVPPPYPAPTAEVILDPICVVKAIDCYASQTCEHDGWRASAAHNYCARLRAAVMSGLPSTSDGPPSRTYPVGWHAAPWGITDLSQAAVVSRQRRP